MSTTELVEKIDAKWSDWSLWRTAEKSWVVHSKGEGTFSADTIEGALQDAADYVPLPKIPRRPSGVGSYEVKKSGTRWDVHHNGRMLTGGYTTKKEATAISEKLAEREREAWEAWMTEHAHYVETHTEGVDFRWAS